MDGEVVVKEKDEEEENEEDEEEEERSCDGASQAAHFLDPYTHCDIEADAHT